MRSRSILMMALFLTYGCKPLATVDSFSEVAASEIPAAGRPIRIALGDQASTSDQSAYRLFAHIPDGAEREDVQFCMGQVQQCQAGLATKVEVISATLTSGRSVFVTKSFIKLSANLPVTVIARSTSGQALYQTALIQPPGGANTYGLPGTTVPGVQQPGYPSGYGTQPLYPTQPGYPGAGYPAQPGYPSGYGTQPGFPSAGYPGGQPNSGSAGGCIEADPEICQIELAIVQYTNQYRAQAGLQPVQYHPKLAWASRQWAAQRQIGHAGFPSQRQSDYRQKFGNLDVTMSSENVAMNNGSVQQMGEKFATQWFNSAGHKENMLASGVTLLGAGVFRSGNSSFYAVQIFGR